jgi:hypothetical protein
MSKGEKQVGSHDEQLKDMVRNFSLCVMVSNLQIFLVF